MEVQEDAFAGLAIVGLVNTDGDLATSLAGRNGAISSPREVDGHGQRRLTKFPHLTIFGDAYLPPSGPVAGDAFQESCSLLCRLRDILRLELGGFKGDIASDRHFEGSLDQ